MKSINTLAVATVLALTCASFASAQNVYRVTGSTAYRVADVTAEVQVCGGATAKATYFGSSLTGANISVVTDSTGTQTVFENYFNGSIAGDEALVDGKTQLGWPKYSSLTGSLTPTTVSSAGSVSVFPPSPASGGNGFATAPAYTSDTGLADISFSDVFFDTADQVILASTDKTSTQPVNVAAASNVVGVVPFVFVANGSTDVYSELSGLSMDPQKFQYTWVSQGGIALSFFTGNNADEGTTVYPFGRDADSGTRATALAETGYGGKGPGSITSVVYQYYPYDTATHATSNSNTTGVIGNDSTLTNPTIGALNFTPANSVDGYSMPKGDSGYNSGGNLAIGISTGFASGTVNTAVVTYLGLSDAQTALTASKSGTNGKAAVLWGYNGVTFYPYAPSGYTNPANTLPNGLTYAANQSLIYEGKYTFWGYEHCYYNSNQSGTAAIAASLQSTLTGTGGNGYDQLSSFGVTYSNLNVTRSDDGQNVQF